MMEYLLIHIFYINVSLYCHFALIALLNLILLNSQMSLITVVVLIALIKLNLIITLIA